MADNWEENSVKYLQFQSVVDHSFWHKLCQVKLDVDKLEENERNIWGFYLNPQVCSMYVDYSSFNSEVEWKLYSNQFTSLGWLCTSESKCKFPLVAVRGVHKNFNTLEGFKQCDKNSVLCKSGANIRENIITGRAVRDPTLLINFTLLTFADLKKHDFYYWFSFPASLSLQASYTREPAKLRDLIITPSQLEGLLTGHKELTKEQRIIFGLVIEEDTVSCITLNEYITRLNTDVDEEVRRDSLYLCYLDPWSEVKHPGWPLRNILALISYHWKHVEKFPLRVISFRLGPSFLDSPVFYISIKVTDRELSRWVGWERNSRDKLGPKFTSLKDSMDPSRLAESSAELNLKLMKWRLAPSLDLDVISSQRVLILGAGTLGCALARNLLGWGVKRMTFVDSGVVSYSNPVRQSLYNHGDCHKDKATAAASAITNILPSVSCEGVVLEISMPGHVGCAASLEEASRLHDLIERHDSVFLVTDSRESRWLPTLIATSLNKICITAALGFDTYLVIRHGLDFLPPQPSSCNQGEGVAAIGGVGEGAAAIGGGLDRENKLGCYFCNDVTAPGDSKYDRTLDQQCTVSRPGVSNIAAALASELYISLLQAQVEGVNSRGDRECLLGDVPHSIRGFLSTFSHLVPSTTSFSKCIACSPTVIDLYRKERSNFLSKVFESSSYLEQVTGLDELHSLTQDIQDFCLSEEESEDGGD